MIHTKQHVYTHNLKFTYTCVQKHIIIMMKVVMLMMRVVMMMIEVDSFSVGHYLWIKVYYYTIMRDKAQ